MHRGGWSLVLIVVALALAVGALRTFGQGATDREPAPVVNDPVAQLDVKIMRGLERDGIDYASKAFVRVVWDDFKRAHLAADTTAKSYSHRFRMPDIEDYDELVGTYDEGDGERIEITRDAHGRFFVRMEGHDMPAVPTNHVLVFTTGDVGGARLPKLTEDYYCTLEMVELGRFDGKWYMFSYGASPEQWRELTRVPDEQ